MSPRDVQAFFHGAVAMKNNPGKEYNAEGGSATGVFVTTDVIENTY